MTLAIWEFFWQQWQDPYRVLTSAPYAPQWCSMPGFPPVFQPNVFQNNVFQVGPPLQTWCALTSAPYTPSYCALTSTPYWPG